MENSKLVAARAMKRWTIAKVCDLTGISEKTYRRCERGTHKPHFYTIEVLCQAFKMNAEDLGLAQYPTALSADQPSNNNSDTVTLTREQATTMLSLLEFGEGTMAQFDPQRRSALLTALQAVGTASGVAVVIPPLLTNPEPWERLTRATTQPSALNSETLSTFETVTEACWKLSNSGELIIAETTLSSFLPILKQVAPSDSSAASLASRGVHLQSILTHHILDKPTGKVTICQHSVDLAKQSGDYSTLVTTLTELAVAYRYAEQYEEALKTCQENICYCDQATPLVQARAYAEAALAFALRNRRREASFYFDLAQEIFPDHPEQDASFWFADSGYHVLMLRELFIHLKFGEAEAAWDTFEQFKQQYPSLIIPERYRLEIVNAQGRAALLGNDLERYAYCLEEGIAGSIALKSKKRFTEAYSIFQQEMPKDWLQHHKIKPIVERYQLQSEG